MNFLNLRLAKTFTTLQGQNVELTADLFNTFSLLDAAGIRNDWGRVKQVSGFENNNLLLRTGWDFVNQRSTYALNSNNMATKYFTQDAARWRLQVGMKYSF